MYQVELFSMEALLVAVLAALLGLAGVVQVLVDTTGKVSRLNNRIDRAVAAVYVHGRVLPYLMLAAVIAVIAPVYDMYTDAEWIDRITGGGRNSDGGRPPTWAELVQAERVTLKHLMHVIQSAIALFILWLYSILWVVLLERAEQRGRRKRTPLERAAFLGGFAWALGVLSAALQWLGQNPALVLHLPM